MYKASINMHGEGWRKVCAVGERCAVWGKWRSRAKRRYMGLVRFRVIIGFPISWRGGRGYVRVIPREEENS